MYLKFINLKVKNFMSYGNSLTTFDFENGLSLISAKNGSGKSSIGPEALSYGRLRLFDGYLMEPAPRLAVP